MLVRKKAIDEAGPFSPDIFMYGEEIELCFRLKAVGWKIVFEPNARIIHVGGASWSEKACSSTYLKMRGLLYFIKKHYPVSTYWGVSALSGMGATLRLLVWSLLYLFIPKEKGRAVLEIKSNFKFLVQIMTSSLFSAKEQEQMKGMT